MPDKRHHRGPDPEDARWFTEAGCETMRQAVDDLCWLLNRGYGLPSAVELVGNRYDLVRRQRIAVARCVCADEAGRRRRVHQAEPTELRGQELWLDGYNVLNAIEAALSGGVILLGRDGCYRDLAAVHGRYRLVEETLPALRSIGEWAASWGTVRCRWWLDRPVSNSGRLQRVLIDLASTSGWDWAVDLVYNPDRVLIEADHIVATSDSVILDRCARWVNLARCVIDSRVPGAWVARLAGPGVASGEVAP